MGKPPKEAIIASRYLDREIFAGGVFAAANHVASICAQVDIVTCLGAAGSYEDLIRQSLRPNVRLHAIYRPSASTTVKRRFVDPSNMRKLFEVYVMDDEPLMKDLQQELGLTYIFVAHDLSVVRHVSDRIAVMYLGKVVELAPAQELYRKPIHPYTAALLSAIPIPDPKENAARKPLVLEGDVPSPLDPPAACRFHTRCPHASEICTQVEPPLVDYGNGHLAACHHPLNLDGAALASAKVAPDSPLSAGDELPSGPAGVDR
jgi:oligopeptide/dipeptide ABC transporter ATP-binding protein